jgi:quercetin dioxygenase-like cupin family protein
MKVYKLENMKKGWFVGNFHPTTYQTDLFEVGTTLHLKGSHWDTHYHKKATEITWIISGKMRLQDKILNTGDIFILEPWEIANPEFLEDTQVLVIKTPSDPNDKYSIEHV